MIRLIPLLDSAEQGDQVLGRPIQPSRLFPIERNATKGRNDKLRAVIRQSCASSGHFLWSFGARRLIQSRTSLQNRPRHDPFGVPSDCVAGVVIPGADERQGRCGLAACASSRTRAARSDATRCGSRCHAALLMAAIPSVNWDGGWEWSTDWVSPPLPLAC